MSVTTAIRNFIKKVLNKLGLRKPENPTSVRQDLEIIPVQPSVDLHVYWKVLAVGKGPAVVLKVHDMEVLKFDCFGKDKGHYHVAPYYGFRIFYVETTSSAQIQRTIEELKSHAQKYISMQEDEKVKSVLLDQEKFLPAVEKAGQKLEFFLQTIPEFEDLR